MHKTCEPLILYFGAPVVLISTRNADGSANIAPMSSTWFLGWGCMIGLNRGSQTTINLLREKECVLNLLSADQAHASDRLSRLTGTNPVPSDKQAMGYRYENDKFRVAGLTEAVSEFVNAPRAAECRVQLEAVVQACHPFGGFDPIREFGTQENPSAHVLAFELKIVRVHVDESLMVPGQKDRIDSDKWNPLIMSFAQYYGLAPGRLLPSKLAEIPEEQYRPAEKMSR
jgi:flavin reductase (DIM6/NTAB) family NADH-FMN oxidoreductase RutF